MQETGVIIVGAGPSGLALAVALSQFKVKSVVLEKEHDICSDPRAIALAGDTLRIIYHLGISEEAMGKIGQALSAIHFHNGPFNTKPFFSLDHDIDWLDQAVPNALVILQPALEQALRDIAQASDYITLNLDCEVVGVQENESVVQAVYKQKGEAEKLTVQGKYLVGADGKRGFVRKRYLEERGIIQETGVYKYEATWVAANLRVTMPTPESHPDFPLWGLGYEPEDLRDLFWPDDFHFCTHATMPVATGWFGPADRRYWRFEYELPPNFKLPDDMPRHLEEQMKPHLTLPASRLRRDGRQPEAPVRFPWDCIEIVRCAPAHFAQKVVNRWYDGHVILIGDAAHVFPPFGAQGIANGLRDALGLSWRLSLLLESETSQKPLPYDKDALLTAWSRERRQGVDEAARLTSSNGFLLLSKSVALPAAVQCASTAINFVPWVRDAFLQGHLSDSMGVQGVEGGFFLKNSGGGTKNAQVFIRNTDGSLAFSDELFRNSAAALTLAVLNQPTEEECLEISQLLKRVNLPTSFLSKHVVCLDSNPENGFVSSPQKFLNLSTLTPASGDVLRAAGRTPMRRYNPNSIRHRLQAKAKYLLMRTDMIIFSQAQAPEELEYQIEQAWDMVVGSS